MSLPGSTIESLLAEPKTNTRGTVNTAELPVLKENVENATPPAPSFAATRQRGHALSNMGAEGYRYTFLCYDVVVSREAIWIAQTDWLPENHGDYDYVAAEWPRIVELARQWGYHDLGEPLYDTLLDVWVWAVPAICLITALRQAPGIHPARGFTVSL